MKFFKDLLKPNLKKLKSKHDIEKLMKELKKYSEKYDDFAEEISDAIVDIGTLETLIEMLQIKLIDDEHFSRTSKFKFSSEQRRAISETAWKLQKKIALTATPLTLPDDALNNLWEIRFKNINHDSNTTSIEELKRQHEQKTLQGEKCPHCFHSSLVKLTGNYSVQSWDPDVFFGVKSICLYCGHMISLLGKMVNEVPGAVEKNKLLYYRQLLIYE
ncbi:MAG: hypothetical protein MUO77_03080 [Anaerolineales bacterium]|nr:hypothetical protein [Anaerolineales bacterium]